MKILILHRIPYHKIDYGRGINHEEHDVTYFGRTEILDSIPPSLRCEKVLRPEGQDVYESAANLFDGNFDFVISLSEYELIEAAKLRELWGVPGPTVSQTEQVRNKVLMKALVGAQGIRVPRNGACHLLNYQLDSQLWSGPTVLKPVDGASSENVVVYPTFMEALHVLRSGKTGIPGFDPRRYQIEEFIKGPILHIDGLVKDGELITVLASRYIGTCLQFAEGSPLGSVQLDPEISGELFAWSSRCLSAVGLTQGAFHLEAILTPHGPVFLEVGARVGGADVVDTFELATGVHLPSTELQIILGEEINLPKAWKGRDSRYGWFVFPGHHLGTEHCRLHGVEEFPWSPQVFRWNQLSPHERLPSQITYQAKEVPVAGILEGSTTACIEKLMKQIFSKIEVLPQSIEPFALPTPRWV